MDSSVRPLAMARRWNQRPPPPVLLLLLLLLLPPPLPLLLEAGDPLPTKGQLMNSCIQARKKCQADYSCNATYRYLKSCSSNISTSSPAEEPSVSEDCLEAVQHLQNTSLMSCTCHRRMKNQTACLDIYWTVHPARTLDDYELNISPYEDTVTRKLWKMNPRKLKQLKPEWDLCLKFAMLCALNGKCGRLRKAYGEACSRPRCQRHTCRRQLRTFFEKASEPHAQGMLLCPCAPADLGCGQRRRNTIAPSCALPAETPNCLELRRLCLSDILCRSRLADFQTYCRPMNSQGTCATEKSRCLQAYMGLIGTAMTPNFVSNVNTSVALSCTCRGSGNLQEECERLEESFSHNLCLTEAIEATMHLHSQRLSQASPVMEHQKTSPAVRPQPWVPSLFSCTFILILLPSFW
ncbi:PREDICTED: GDNF family receptor alpha-3 [Hipposideros armiger]|uniref:GDNF family receptor alpha-3 n=1 Tax=Hipposideros armiger TaxID=186990 RepID=A0A8B7SUE0_HIPAR|nr:PREDICTED: GDNF family receptor alpha-3 [Hipposideros armiger]